MTSASDVAPQPVEAAADPGPPEGGYLGRREATTLLVVLLVVNILNFLDRQLPLILAESIRRDLGLTDTQLGLIGGLAFAVCYALMALPLARLADRWSAKKVLAGCLLVWSVMTAVGGMSRNFAELAITRLGVACGEAGSTPSAHVLIARAIRPERRGFALGLFSAGTPLGVMLGLGVGGWINDVSSWRVAFAAAGGLGVGVLALMLVFVPDLLPPPVAKTDAPRFVDALKRLFADAAFRWVFTAIVLAGAAIYGMLTFTAPYLIRVHGMTTTQVGLSLGMLQGVFGLAGTILGGRVFDAYGGGNRALLAPGLAFLVAVPCAAGAWFAPNATMAILAMLPVVFAYSFYIPGAFGVAHRVAGREGQAVASSLLLIGLGLLGASVGPLAVGAISDALAPRHGVLSVRYALLFVPALNLLAGLAFLRASRRL